ncbi:MAG: hypothetical protein OYH77_01020 [Pseudomonadota bacterium]|nr:hypothetical protein [Pseudomonadota bacterium]
MRFFILLVLVAACAPDVEVDPTDETTPTGETSKPSKTDKKPNVSGKCPASEKTSNEYYNLNFIKPPSAEHTDILLGYFQRFNTEIKEYHPSKCAPLDDMLVFADDSSDACDISDRGSVTPSCPLYSRISLIALNPEGSDTKEGVIGGHGGRSMMWVGNADTRRQRYWMRIKLDTASFLEMHAKHPEVAWLVFLHEIGHGFDFQHDEDDARSVMHPTLTNKNNFYDYDTYFQRVYEIVTTVHID